MPEPNEDLDMMNLDDIRMKDAGDLTDEEKGVLKENEDFLTDEEKEEFKDILEGKGDTGDTGGDKGDTGKEPEALPFKTKAELDAYLNEQIEARMKKAEPEPKSDRGEEEEEDFFPQDYKPKTWNEVADQLYSKFADRFREQTRKEQQETTSRLKEINEGFDKELDELRTAGEDIPAKGTEERAKFDRELAKIGVEYDQTSMIGTYKIYKALKSATKPGSGLSDRQKKLASKIGTGGGGNATPGQKARKYSEEARRSFDDRIAEATRQLEAGG